MALKRINLFREFNFSDRSIRLFYLFLATDLAFMFLHLIYFYTGLTVNHAFSLESDRGFSEIFQYVKEYWIGVLLVVLFVKTSIFLYVAWSLLFFYLLLDDSVLIHERLGNAITNQFTIPGMFNLRGQDLGELVVIGIVVVVFLILITVSYRFGDSPSRRVSKHLILTMFALAFCGIIVDLIHIAVNSPALNPLLILLEDGGELVVMSFIVCYVFSLFDFLQLKANKSKTITRHYPLESLGRK